MATLNGKNYKKVYVDKPSQKADKGEYNGHVKTLYDEITLAGDLGLGDEILLGKLPVGARVLSAVVKSPSLGSTGILDLGYKANGVDVEDQDGFVAAADAGGQAVQANGTGVAIGKKFDAETTVFAKVTEASDLGNGLTVQAWVHYIVD